MGIIYDSFRMELETDAIELTTLDDNEFLMAIFQGKSIDDTGSAQFNREELNCFANKILSILKQV